ncbi:MAG: hypothetical protein WD928_11710 [Gammaproteobacteria bacterium]
MKLTSIAPRAAFIALLMSPASAFAVCSSNQVEDSFTAVECDNGFDPIGVQAKQGVTHVSVVVRNDGGIESSATAINLNGDSVIEISGLVSSGSGSGIFLSGSGSQQVLVNGFAEVLARNYGIYASGGQFNTEGNINITNFGLLSGPLNNGGIFASGNRTSLVQNFGEIAVAGTGYGINLSGSAGADLLSVLNRGSILAGGYGIRVHGLNALRIDNSAAIDSGGYGLEARYGNDIEIINGGNLRLRGSSGYGIYADNSDGLRQEDVAVSVTNSGDILMESATVQPRGIVAYSSSGVNQNGERFRGDVNLVNSGAITGLSASSTGIEAVASHDAIIENDGIINVAGAGIRVTGSLAELTNRAAITAGLGITMTGADSVGQQGRTILRNSGDILASSFIGVELFGRSIELTNTGDVTSQQRNAIDILGRSDKGQAVAVDVFNSGRLVSPQANTIEVVASNFGGSVARASVINEGELVAGGGGINVQAEVDPKIWTRR